MSWRACLELHYSSESARTVARYRHDGPLRVLRSLYPEGDTVCHNVLVHPPGGLVGGDTVETQVSVAPGAHGLVTTPGATRFYRSLGEPARQRVHARLEADARLEWLPLEALAYNQCQAENRAVFDLAPGAELLGWDITALGLPAADQPFAEGCFTQHLEVPGVWLEQGRIAADDLRLLNSPLGLAGQRCLATLFYASAAPLTRAQREAALERTRAVIDAHALAAHAGVTALNDRLLVVRALAPVTEPASDMWRQIRAAWRATFWQLPASAPRIWAM